MGMHCASAEETAQSPGARVTALLPVSHRADSGLGLEDCASFLMCTDLVFELSFTLNRTVPSLSTVDKLLGCRSQCTPLQQTKVKVYVFRHSPK